MNGLSRITTLEPLRFLLAMWVMLFHFQLMTTELGIEIADITLVSSNFVGKGYFAVPIFWIISGIVMMHRYKELFEVRKFLIARIARLYPLHLLTLFYVLIIQLLSIYNIGSTLIYKNGLTTLDFILNLFLIHGLGFGNTYSFNAPSWSISSEFLAFVFFCYTMRKSSIGIKKSFVLFSVFFFLAIVVAALSFRLGVDPHRYSRCLAAIALFFLGSTIYLSLVKVIPLYLLSIVIIGVTLDILAIKVEKLYLLLSINCFFIIPILVPILYLILRLDLRHKSKSAQSWKNFLGKLSFPIFLTHVPVQMTIIFFSLSFNFVWNPKVLLGFYIVLVMFISWILNIYFEEPARRFLKMRLDNISKFGETI